MASLVWYKVLWEAGVKAELDKKYHVAKFGEKREGQRQMPSTIGNYVLSFPSFLFSFLPSRDVCTSTASTFILTTSLVSWTTTHPVFAFQFPQILLGSQFCTQHSDKGPVPPCLTYSFSSSSLSHLLSSPTPTLHFLGGLSVPGASLSAMAFDNASH